MSRHQHGGSDLDLESFISQHDRLFASTSPQPNSLSPPPISRGNSSTSIAKQLDTLQGQPTSSLKDALAFAQLHIMNDFTTTEGLYAYLDQLNLLDGERLRPGWDTYFMVCFPPPHFTSYQLELLNGAQRSTDSCIPRISPLQLHEKARRSSTGSVETYPGNRLQRHSPWIDKL
jgi:hypothetical protein